MSASRTVTLCGRSLEEPGHICAFFDSRTEEYDILIPYYKEGIALDEEVITIVDAHRQRDHCERLQHKGIDVETEMRDGRLQVLTADDTYMKGGSFGAQRMYELLQGALADAQRMMMEILATHPYIVHGKRIRENPYYVAPLERLREVLQPNPIARSQGAAPLA